MSENNEKAPFEIEVLGICGECSKMYAMETVRSGKLLPCGHKIAHAVLSGSIVRNLLEQELEENPCTP